MGNKIKILVQGLFLKIKMRKVRKELKRPRKYIY
jgi:hypothetical protein